MSSDSSNGLLSQWRKLDSFQRGRIVKMKKEGNPRWSRNYKYFANVCSDIFQFKSLYHFVTSEPWFEDWIEDC